MDGWRAWQWCMRLDQEDIWLFQIWSHQLGSENLSQIFQKAASMNVSLTNPYNLFYSPNQRFSSWFSACVCLLNLQLYICIVNDPVLARGHSNDLWKSKNIKFPNQQCWWSFHLSYTGAADNWQLQHEGAIDAPTAGRSKKHVSSGLQASEGLHRALGGGSSPKRSFCVSRNLQ